MTRRMQQRIHPRVAAETLLQEMGITEPPIPVKKLLKAKCKLFFFEDDAEDGYSCLVDDVPHVYINSNSCIISGRHNFTYAHELGHIVLGHLNIPCLHTLPDEAYWRLDREANIFAANLLMPSHMVLSHINIPVTSKELGRIKDVFQVSWEAMSIRLNTLGIYQKDKPGWLTQCPICSANLGGKLNMYQHDKHSGTINTKKQWLASRVLVVQNTAHGLPGNGCEHPLTEVRGYRVNSPQ